MYRGQPYIPPAKPCKPCNGTGRIGLPSPPGSYACTSCNGTGIEGDPRWLMVFLIIWCIILTSLVAYCTMK